MGGVSVLVGALLLDAAALEEPDMVMVEWRSLERSGRNSVVVSTEYSKTVYLNLAVFMIVCRSGVVRDLI